MATSSSTLDPDNLPDNRPARARKDTAALGPSDSTDSGSDLADEEIPDVDASGREVDTDRYGTGERIGSRAHASREAGDIETDRVVGEEEAGLGGGLDQAEEARLGITDEQVLSAPADADPFRKVRRRIRDLGGRRAGDGKT